MADPALLLTGRKEATNTGYRLRNRIAICKKAISDSKLVPLSGLHKGRASLGGRNYLDGCFYSGPNGGFSIDQNLVASFEDLISARMKLPVVIYGESLSFKKLWGYQVGTRNMIGRIRPREAFPIGREGRLFEGGKGAACTLSLPNPTGTD